MVGFVVIVVHLYTQYMVVLWLGLSLLSSVSIMIVFVIVVIFRKHNMWWYYG